MVALRKELRVERARTEGSRTRSAMVIELAGRHEFHHPVYERRLTVEPKFDPLHWVIGLVIAGSFVAAVVALLNS